MSEIIRVNTARLAADSGKIRDCIKGMTENAEAIDLKLADIAAECEETVMVGTIETFRSCILELRACMGDLEKVCMYEEEARRKYERCVGHVDSVIEGIVV